MTARTPISTKTLYDRDFQLWIETTVEQLRGGDFASVDWENVIEEIEDMGTNNRNAVKNLSIQLLAHILKIVYWDSERDYNSRKWEEEIMNFRERITSILKSSPSLRSYYVEIFDSCYEKARKRVMKLSGLTIPVEKIVTPEEALDEDWFPTI